jgi:hypothetical protein
MCEWEGVCLAQPLCQAPVTLIFLRGADRSPVFAPKVLREQMNCSVLTSTGKAAHAWQPAAPYWHRRSHQQQQDEQLWRRVTASECMCAMWLHRMLILFSFAALLLLLLYSRSLLAPIPLTLLHPTSDPCRVLQWNAGCSSALGVRFPRRPLCSAPDNIYTRPAFAPNSAARARGEKGESVLGSQRAKIHSFTLLREH